MALLCCNRKKRKVAAQKQASVKSETSAEHRVDNTRNVPEPKVKFEPKPVPVVKLQSKIPVATKKNIANKPEIKPEVKPIVKKSPVSKHIDKKSISEEPEVKPAEMTAYGTLADNPTGQPSTPLNEAVYYESFEKKTDNLTVTEKLDLPVDEKLDLPVDEALPPSDVSSTTDNSQLVIPEITPEPAITETKYESLIKPEDYQFKPHNRILQVDSVTKAPIQNRFSPPQNRLDKVSEWLNPAPTANHKDSSSSLASVQKTISIFTHPDEPTLMATSRIIPTTESESSDSSDDSTDSSSESSSESSTAKNTSSGSSFAGSVIADGFVEAPQMPESDLMTDSSAKSS